MGLLSVAGANFSSTNAAEQGRIPQLVNAFDQFLNETPPKVIVFYMMKDAAPPGCYGKGVVQNNFDFRKVPYLSGLAEVLTRFYHSDGFVEGPCDRAELFLRN
jgi:hypothetical protein